MNTPRSRLIFFLLVLLVLPGGTILAKKKAKKPLRSESAAEVSGTAGVRGLELKPDEAPKKKKTWKSKGSKPTP